MSEEMNLYKRCKNIFKAHGVDMGGGGSGGGAMVVTFEVDGYNLNCDKTVTEVRTVMAQGIPVIGVMTEDGNSRGMGPCFYDTFSECIGFMHWINDGELKFLIEGPDDSDDWRLGS